MAEKGHYWAIYVFTVTRYKSEIIATILITKKIADMTGTIYGNRLPGGKQ
jgi:hypothetical protein